VDRFFVFVVAVLVSAQAQKRYFDALAAANASVMSDEDLANVVLDRPIGVVRAAGKEVPRRLLALWHRQRSKDLEVERRFALAAIGLMIAALGWTALPN
jgi:hypothetical protein